MKLMETLGFFLMSLMTATSAVAAQRSLDNYPVKPVRVIVVFPPGSGTDIASRAVAQELTEAFGRQFVIDNRPGAGGMIGTEIAAHSAPDGYTLLAVSSSYTINPSVYAKVPYDPKRDLQPISLIASTPYLMIAHPSLHAKTVSDVIALARAKPGALSYAAGGVGVGSHLAGELFKAMAKVDIVMVPYKGAPQATADVVAGQVQLGFGTMPTALPLVKAGKLHALGVTSEKRTSAAPDIPAIAEFGLPQFDVQTWFGILAPAKTPAALTNRIQHAIAEAVKQERVRDRLVAQGYEIVGSTPEQFAALINKEIDKWSMVVKLARIPKM